MRLGRLRQTVAIQTNVPTRSARGAEVNVWTTIATALADVSPLSSREFYNAQQTNSEIAYEVRMHYRDDVTSASRLVWGDVTLEVVGLPINVDGRNRDLFMRCRVVND